MKKLNMIAMAILVTAASVGGYASASEGLLNATTHANADVSLSKKNEVRNETDQEVKGLLERIKDRFETGLRAGTVSQVNTDGSFTIQNKNGNKSATVKTTASTSYTNDGQPSTTASIVVGAMVKIKGAFDKATSTITASVVNIIHELQGVHIKGSIAALSGSTLTVKADNGTVYTVDASKAQIFHTFWFGTSGDIKVGDNVAVWGTHLKDSTSISARWVKDTTPKPETNQ